MSRLQFANGGAYDTNGLFVWVPGRRRALSSVGKNVYKNHGHFLKPSYARLSGL